MVLDCYSHQHRCIKAGRNRENGLYGNSLALLLMRLLYRVWFLKEAPFPQVWCLKRSMHISHVCMTPIFQ